MTEKYSVNRLNDRILEAVSDLSWLRDKVAEFAADPTPEKAGEIELVLSKFDRTRDAIRNSVMVVAKEITGTDVDDNGEMEIDVIPDENGYKI